MRIVRIDHEEERSIRAPGLAQKLRDKFPVQIRASPVEHLFALATVLKGVLSRRHDVIGLAEDPGVETVPPQRLRQRGYAGSNLVEAQRAAVVRIAAGHPDRPRRLANRYRNVRVLEPQSLSRKPVDVGRRFRNLRTVHAYRIPIHVVHGDEENIQVIGSQTRRTGDRNAEPPRDPSTFHVACFVATLWNQYPSLMLQPNKAIEC